MSGQTLSMSLKPQRSDTNSKRFCGVLPFEWFAAESFLDFKLTSDVSVVSVFGVSGKVVVKLFVFL
jgi:hypothetical protein